MRNKQKGFSLIELLIVVAIILIIAAIAIPNLLRSKMAANEASAVASLRTLNTSVVAYSTTYATDPPTWPLWAPRPRRLPPLQTWLTTCSASTRRRRAAIRLLILRSAATPITQYTITGRPTVDLTGQRKVLHRPEWRDSANDGWFHADCLQPADRLVMYVGNGMGEEGNRLSPTSTCTEFQAYGWCRRSTSTQKFCTSEETRQ